MRLAAALTVLLAAVAATPAHAASQNVTFGEFFYRADRVRIEPGDSVTWTNRGEVLHTVTSRRGAPERFDSDVVDSGQSFTRAFTKPGTYDYLCTLHPDQMRGVVQVGPDRLKPKLTNVSAKAGKLVRVAYRVSETARVTVKVTRRGRTVRSGRSKKATTGAGKITLKLPAAARYRVVVTATDLAGNKGTGRASLTVR